MENSVWISEDQNANRNAYGKDQPQEVSLGKKGPIGSWTQGRKIVYICPCPEGSRLINWQSKFQSSPTLRLLQGYLCLLSCWFTVTIKNTKLIWKVWSFTERKYLQSWGKRGHGCWQAYVLKRSHILIFQTVANSCFEKRAPNFPKVWFSKKAAKSKSSPYF